MIDDPLLRRLDQPALAAMDSETLDNAVGEALGFYAGRSNGPEQLISIGLRLAGAGRHEMAARAIRWAEETPDNERLFALGHLLQGMWDAFTQTARVCDSDVRRVVALRATAQPGFYADHALLMALAPTLTRPNIRPFVAPLLERILAESASTSREQREHRLLAAAVRTYLDKTD